jgi:hypothetical protein
MTPETRKGATVLLGCFGLVALGFIIFYIYIGIQFANDVADLAKSIDNRHEKFKHEKIYPKRYGERQVLEVSETTFKHEKEFHEKWKKVKKSKFSKQNEKIKIETEKGGIVFENHSDKNCMACVEVYEISGDNLGLEKTVVEAGYFRNSEFYMIDWKSGRIDTLSGLPSFNLSNNSFLTSNYNSKDSLAHGLLLYEIEEDKTKFIRQVGKGWFAVDYFWGYANEIYCEAFLIINGEPALENKKYIRIHNVLK